MTRHRVLLTADAVGGVWTFALELARGLADQGVETLLAVLGTRPGRGAAAGGVRGPGPAAGAHRPAARVAGPGRALRRGRPPAAPGAGARVPPRHRPRQRLPRGGGRLRRPGAAHRPLLRQDLVAGLPRRRPAARVGRSTRPACARAWRRPTRSPPPPPRTLPPSPALWDPLPPARVVPNGLDLPSPPPACAGPWSWPPGACGTRRRGSRASPPSPHGCPGRSRSRARRPPARPARACTTSAGWRRRTCTPAWRRRRSSPPPPATSPSASASWRPRTQGCALVLGELPSLVELWKGAARFVPPGEPEALLAALQELIADTSARERLADAARERAALYTRARMTEGYLGLYGDLLAARRVVRRRAA